MRTSVTALLLVLAWLGPASAQQAINRYLELRNQQDWAGALDVIRDEIRSPALDSAGYLSDIRLLGLQALGASAYAHGLAPGMNEEAQRYLDEGLRHASNDIVRQGRILHGAALYFTGSYQPGRAIPYLRRELDVWQGQNNTYQVLLTHDSMASTYGDMGETELEEYFRRKAMEIADGYFVLGQTPTDGNQWLGYDNILRKHADSLSAAGELDELLTVLALRERISEKYLTFNALTKLQSAKLLAIAGQPEKAAESMRQARARWREERQQLNEPMLSSMSEKMSRDFICGDAQILHQAGRAAEALPAAHACEQSWQQAGESLGGATLGLIGTIYEAGGDDAEAIRAYRAAIASMEATRGSYEVAQRAAFFRQDVSRRPYWGLIRTLSRRAQASGKADDFHLALQATERIRARQFGELANPRSDAAISADELRRIQRALPLDTVVLDYVVTDEAIVLNAFTRDRHLTAVTAMQRSYLRAGIRGIVTRLADPDSDPTDLQRRLLEDSGAILAPAAGLIADRDQVLVLTDGELSLVPFGLWSVDTKKYQPLLSLKTVRAVPSLRFLAQTGSATKANRGLFGVADPAYKAPEAIGGTPTDDIRGAMRGGDLLANFQSLPETRDEVEAIARLLPQQKSRMLLGSDAVESKVKSTPLADYRFLHFATHGVLGGDVPGLVEPALVLGDESGEDGFLKASEAEQLKLNAALTVLSACNTGSGEFVHGEGVMGMSRAFLLAGSDAVLVSLWPVASKPTEDLMVRFYRHLQDGVPATAALRHAKIEMQATLPHPFFWAPFVLIGRT